MMESVNPLIHELSEILDTCSFYMCMKVMALFFLMYPLTLSRSIGGYLLK